MTSDIVAHVAPDPAIQWWGYSKEHGWIVLDRSIAGNAPSKSKTMYFLRCKDLKVIPVLREKWNPPAYQYAPNYLGSLSPLDEGARATWQELQARWPEFEPEIQRQCAELAAAEPAPI